MGYINAIIGDVWNIINPWKIIFEFFENNFKHSKNYYPIYKYPKKLDAWPSVILFLLFAWFENIFDTSTPYKLSNLIIIYSIITWTGMILYGKYAWIEYADPFSKFFKIMSKFSITEIKILDINNCSRRFVLFRILVTLIPFLSSSEKTSLIFLFAGSVISIDL